MDGFYRKISLGFCLIFSLSLEFQIDIMENAPLRRDTSDKSEYRRKYLPMAKINEIYTSNAYYPFLCYCESHGYAEMRDLIRCPFSKLKEEPDMTPALVSRIHITFLAYLKAHPQEFLLEKRKAAAAAARTPKPALEEAESQLERFFQQNASRLIHISEAAKAVTGQKVKRADLAALLEKASWCKAVDGTTYFYCGNA